MWRRDGYADQKSRQILHCGGTTTVHRRTRLCKTAKSIRYKEKSNPSLFGIEQFIRAEAAAALENKLTAWHAHQQACLQQWRSKLKESSCFNKYLIS